MPTALLPQANDVQHEQRVPPYKRYLGAHGLFWISGISVTIVVLVFGWLLFQPSGTTATSFLANGTVAPNFTLTDASGRTVQLAQYRGHPVVMNFWATFCGPCRTETPMLQQTSVANAKQGLVILGIDQGEPLDAISAFGKEFGLTYPLLADVTLSVNKLYGVTALPATYFIDAGGTIRYTVNGILRPTTFTAGLQAIGISPAST